MKMSSTDHASEYSGMIGNLPETTRRLAVNCFAESLWIYIHNFTDGDTDLSASAQPEQGGADNGSAGDVLATIINNEPLNFEIELASDKKKLIVPQLIVADAAEIELSLEVSDMIWVIFDADTKKVRDRVQWTMAAQKTISLWAKKKIALPLLPRMGTQTAVHKRWAGRGKSRKRAHW